MRIGLRMLFGFFLVAGMAAVFILRVVLVEVKPSVREVMEDLLVDSANLLAEQAAADLQSMPAGGNLANTRFAGSVLAYVARPIDVQIWGLKKTTLDLRVYVTDASGRVVFDSGQTVQAPADYSRWRDVNRTLRGEYGARSTREVATDDGSLVMVVAAPVTAHPGGPLIGVLSVAKPMATVQKFIDRAERRIAVAGAWLLAVSIAVGLGVTIWTVHSVRQLRRFALLARDGERPAVPKLPGELGDLAHAMGAMRDRLDNRAQVEQGMRALTHELKSPLTAIGGAAELLQDDLPAQDRQRFASQITQQVRRLRDLVDRLLELSKLESLQAPQTPRAVSLVAMVQEQLVASSALLQQRSLRVLWLQDDPTPVQADADRLALALSNLLANAMDFAPDGSTLELSVSRSGRHLVLGLRDHGPGVPGYAFPQLGQRFFSTARPRDGSKGTGLGLAIVRQVVLLHRGELQFENAEPGLRVLLKLPLDA
jgi:two-component system sensor histidine kinase CreC